MDTQVGMDSGGAQHAVHGVGLPARRSCRGRPASKRCQLATHGSAFGDWPPTLSPPHMVAESKLRPGTKITRRQDPRNSTSLALEHHNLAHDWLYLNYLAARAIIATTERVTTSRAIDLPCKQFVTATLWCPLDFRRRSALENCVQQGCSQSHVCESRSIYHVAWYKIVDPSLSPAWLYT